LADKIERRNRALGKQQFRFSISSPASFPLEFAGQAGLVGAEVFSKSGNRPAF